MQFSTKFLRSGQTNFQVWQLQRLLQQKGYAIQDAPGKLGETTQAAVRAFQEAHQLPVTGKIDTAMVELLNKQWPESALSETVGFTIQGKLTHAENKQPLAGYTVEIWEKDKLRDDLLGRIATAGNGAYRLAFYGHRFMDDPLDFPPQIFFRVLDAAGMLLLNTREEAQQLLPGTHTLPLSVDPDAGLQAQFFRVFGRVTGDCAIPAAGVLVRAHDRQLGNQLLSLGETRCQDDGSYSIWYDPQQLPDGKQQADLVLTIHHNSQEPAIFQSDLVADAEPLLQLDITLPLGVYRGISEYESITEGLRRHFPAFKATPELQPQSGAPSKSLSLSLSQDIQLLSRKLKRPQRELQHFFQAAQLAQANGLAPEICYGLCRQGKPADLKEYAHEDVESLTRALRKAVVDNQIKVDVQKLPEIAEAMVDKTIDLVYDENHPFTRLVRMEGYASKQRFPEKKLSDFIRLYVKTKDKSPVFWSQLPEKLQISVEATENLKFTLQLNDITRAHLPLITAIQRKGKRSLRSLVGFNWQVLVGDKQIGVPPGIEGDTPLGQRNTYIRILEDAVERAFPTAVFADYLKKNGNGFPGKADLNQFFKQFPDYDFRSSHIRRFVREQEGVIDQIGLKDKGDCFARLFQLQRLFNITPETRKFETIPLLLQHRIDSAHNVKRMGRSTFVRDYTSWRSDRPAEETQKVAREIYRRASRIAMGTLAVYGKYGRAFNNISMYGLPALAPPKSNGQSANINASNTLPIPEWEELFGALDYWQCSEGQSAYSPAAYLADLLIYLEHASPDGAARAELERRRPDIFNLLLNGENAFTEIPYIDLVLEVMEGEILNKIYAPITNPKGIVDDLNDTKINNVLANLIKEATGISLIEDKSTVKIIKRSKSWQIIHFALVVRIDLENNKLYLKYSRQSPPVQNGLPKVSPDPKVYEFLRGRMYPWNLPFDLWGEEARVYLNHLGVPLYRLMEVFRTSSADIDDGLIALEYLGISFGEGIIMGLPCPIPPFTKDDQLEGIHVDEFMSKLNLTYDELVALLRVKFINKNNNTVIVFSYDENNNEKPDLTEATFLGLDLDVAYRLQRFNRLYRRLPWSLSELDKVIQLFDDEMSKQLVINIAYIRRIQELFKVPVLTLMSWWTGLDTLEYEGEVSLYDQLFLLPLQKNAQVQAIVKEAFTKAKENKAIASLLALDIEANIDIKPYLYLPTIQGVLGISLEDLLDIIGRENAFLEKGKDKKPLLSLNNLSYLYAIATFCKATGLKIRDYYVFQQFAGNGPEHLPSPINKPNTPVQITPKDTYEFLKQLDFLRQSKISIEELGYYLRHQIEPRSTLPPIDKTIQVFLTEVQTETRKILAENNPAPVSAEDALQTELKLCRNLFHSPAGELDLISLLNIVLGKSNLPFPEQESQLNRYPQLFPIPESCYALVDRGLLKDKDARRKFVLDQLPSDQKNLENYLNTLPLDDTEFAICETIIWGIEDSSLPYPNRERFIRSYSADSLEKPKAIFSNGEVACAKLVDRGLLLSIPERVLFMFKQWASPLVSEQPDIFPDERQEEEYLQKLQQRLAQIQWQHEADQDTCFKIIINKSGLTYQQQHEFIKRYDKAVFRDSQLACEKLVDRGLLSNTSPEEREKFVSEQWPFGMHPEPNTSIWDKLKKIIPIQKGGLEKCVAIIEGSSPINFRLQEAYIRRNLEVFTQPDEAVNKLVNRGLLTSLDARVNYVNIFSVDPSQRSALDSVLCALQNKLRELFGNKEEEAQQALSIVAGTCEPEVKKETFIDDHFGLFMDATEARSRFIDSNPASGNFYQNVQFLWRILLLKPYLIKKFSETFDLPPAVTQPLLEKYITIPYNSYRIDKVFDDQDYATLWNRHNEKRPDADMYHLDLETIICDSAPAQQKEYFLNFGSEREKKQFFPLQPSTIILEVGKTAHLETRIRFYRKLNIALWGAPEHPGSEEMGFCSLRAKGTTSHDTEIKLQKKGEYRAKGTFQPLRKALNVFLDHVFLLNSHSPLDAPQEYNANMTVYRLLHKVAFFYKHLSMRPEDIPYVFEKGPSLGWLDLATLPAAFDGTSTKNGTQWANFRKLVQGYKVQKYINRYRSDRFYLMDWLSAYYQASQASGETAETNKAALLKQLQQALDWNGQDLQFLFSSAGLNITTVFDGAFLAPVQACFDMLAHLGGSASDIAGLKQPPLNSRQAQLVKDLVRSRYSDDQWKKVEEELEDPLREKRRDALVTYLLAFSGDERRKQVEDLYEYYLIDPLMSACFNTSRIKQAISSVQLFVQRILMNLEAGDSANLTIKADEAEEWNWRKYYRLWEANRKVFLYPENWIEPELRDDKSPFFQELEDELLQDEVTQESVERVYMNYLYKLNEVARLDVRAECYDDIKKELHVFARTYGEAPVYYYRKWNECSGIWTAWEKVDLDIEGDHLVPVVHNGKLMLFWPVFKEKADKDYEIAVGEGPDGKKKYENPKYFEIQMAWSELKSEKWQPKKVSKDRMSLKEELTNAIDIFNKESGQLILDIKYFYDGHIFNKQRFDFSVDSTESSVNINVRYFEKLIIFSEPFSEWNLYLNLRRFEYESNNVVAGILLSYLTPANSEDYVLFRNRLPYNNQFVNYCFKKENYKLDITQIYLHITSHNVAVPTSVKIYQVHIKIDDKPEIIRAINLDCILYQNNHPHFYYLTKISLALSGYKHISLKLFVELKFENPKFSYVCYCDCGLNILLSPFTIQYLPSSYEGIVTIVPDRLDYLIGENCIADKGVYWENAKLLDVQSDSVLTLDSKFREQSTNLPFFFSDFNRSFLLNRVNDIINFSIFYHPFAQVFNSLISNRGLDSLLNPTNKGLETDMVRQSIESDFDFGTSYGLKATDFVTVKKIECLFFSENFNEYDLDLAFWYGSSLFMFRDIKFLKDGATQKVFNVSYSDIQVNSISFALKELWGNKERKLKLIPEKKTIEFGTTNFVDFLAVQDLTNPSLEAQFKIHFEWNKVSEVLPIENIDFSSKGAYSLYNWELFFHIPFMTACRLSQNQKFEEAQKWFHYIFDPTCTDTTNIQPGELETKPFLQFWKIKPFVEAYYDEQVKNDIESLLTGDPDLAAHLEAWEDDPYNPHLIARFRVSAYMKAVVMRYLDNLIAWGDQLFRRDTIESINEATQLYILAARLLGRKPEEVAKQQEAYRTFSDLEEHLHFDVMVPVQCPGNSQNDYSDKDVNLVTLSYFCLPNNPKMLEYWATVADRLFKIRNCMNIEGVVRKLALYEPPIDPALLVRAAAAGIDLGSVLNDMYAPLPHYRFQYMLQKALELCNEVKSLGGALLSALEKKDAEQLSILRSRHEIEMLTAIKSLKKAQIEEAALAVESLDKALEQVELAITFNKNKLDISSLPAVGQIPDAKPKLLDEEKKQIEKLQKAHINETNAAGFEFLATVYSAYPDIQIGSSGLGPHSTFSIGGSLFSTAARAKSAFEKIGAELQAYQANSARIMADHKRSGENFSFELAKVIEEKEQIIKQKTGAEIKLSIAEKELENHEKQIVQAEEVESFLKDKYTNAQLYNWMIGQTSGLYFQAYQMAYDIAKQAEKAFRHELGLEDKDTNFIQFGYWDSLKKGLLAGEKLHHDLRRMEIAYLEKNKREYELTKHISLALLNPYALLQLRETGECYLNIPEVLFDLDHPGQYLRRLKSVSLTIPCVAGPYTSVSAKLTLLSNELRRKPNMDDAKQPSFIGIQSIATSHAQNDSGLFELNFRDERYLPFEGAGVVSSWRLELPTEFRLFDYDTISDVIIQMNYTARDGGDAFKETVNTSVRENINKWLDELAEEGAGLPRLFNLKDEFPKEWNDLITQPDHKATFKISHRHFPGFLRDRNISINNVLLFFEPKVPGTTIGELIRTVKIGDQNATGDPAPAFGQSGMLSMAYENINGNIQPPSSGTKAGAWEALLEQSGFTEEEVKNVFMLVQYKVGDRATGNSG